MKKHYKLIAALLLSAFFAAGCNMGKQNSAQDFDEKQQNHAAVKTYRDGCWNVRCHSLVDWYTDRIIRITFYVSFNVDKDLTEQDMLDIMDYYEFTNNAQWDANNNYIGERKTDYDCYAVFYRGETDEELRRIKYLNGEETEISKEEQSYFPKPNMYDSEDEIGGDDIERLP